MESRIALHVQAPTGYSLLTLPTGDTVPLLNVGVLTFARTLQSPSRGSIATATTRAAPKAWADIARNIACDDCLRANSDAVYSTAHAPVAKAAGDLVSYDIYYVSVPHIHGD
eukprot:6182724-Pleurochrysis_carterae.AAC.5